LNLPFLIAGVIIFIGFLGTIFFQKTRIPDILFLIIIGVLIGPGLGWINPKQLESITPYFGRLALIIILFESGLHLDIGVLLKYLTGGLGLAIGTFAVSAGGIWALGVYYLGMTSVNSLLFACILGGISPAIVIPLINQMRVREETRTILNLESIMADIFIILGVIILIQIAPTGHIRLADIMNTIAGSFSIALVAGMIAGFLWVRALSSVSISTLSYMTTLAAVLVLYGLVEMSKGSGAVAAFTFGLVLKNATRFIRVFNETKTFKLDDKIEQFHAEFTFFIRTYFFVYMGMLISPSLFYNNGILQDIILITAALIMVRYIFIWLFCAVYKPIRLERFTHFIMMPRGLATAVVASMPAAAGIAGTENFLSYTVLIILFSNIFMVLGIFVAERHAFGKPLDSAPVAADK
ncbi:MAG: cation:proton antiporter, partial [Planctomycetota bacterium]